MSLRKVASVLVGLGLVIGLMGAGIGASFTDSASATANISVGTFGISISSTTLGAVPVNTGTPGNSVHTITYACPTVQSSAAATCPLQFTITNTGTMPATITVAGALGTGSDTAFSVIAVAAGPTTIPVGGHVDFNGGISWGVLGNGDLTKTASVVYTISAIQ
jgi:hypothetical protein